MSDLPIRWLMPAACSLASGHVRAGDYASGTNHTLPTHQYALAYNGVNLDSYNRKVTFQHLNEDGIRSIGKTVVCMAENEQLEAHANAMRLRMDSLGMKNK